MTTKEDHIVFSAYKFEDLTVEEHYDKSIVMMTNPCESPRVMTNPCIVSRVATP